MTTMTHDIALALHGGAGVVAGRDYAATESHLRELAEDCQHWLVDGRSALDVVEHAVAELETCGLYVAGRGSAPNSSGYVELDASTGAGKFASSNHFAVVDDPANYYTLPVGVTTDDIQDISHGTVGAVALDTSGHLAAATSTGGTFGKLEGRIGDTPLIGPGTWADDNIAISCTGTGEHIIRAGGAAAIAFRYRSGITLTDAVSEMLDEVRRLGGDAGVIAITRDGEIAMPYNSEGMKRASVSTRSALHVATFR
jgi:isoaspartyl peptidase/L-asparaginase-like protein (Ntn-hydrolase superfamily)